MIIIIPVKIGTMNSKIDDLTSEVKHLQTTNTSLVQQLNDQHKVITELREQNSKLELQMSKDMFSDDCDNTSHLFIGSSMIRDVSLTNSDQFAFCPTALFCEVLTTSCIKIECFLPHFVHV